MDYIVNFNISKMNMDYIYTMFKYIIIPIICNTNYLNILYKYLLLYKFLVIYYPIIQFSGCMVTYIEKYYLSNMHINHYY